MLRLLIALLIINSGLLAWNLYPSYSMKPTSPPLTQTGVQSLTLRPDVEQIVYSSHTDQTESSCYTLGPYNSGKAAELMANKIRGFGLAATIRPMRSMETLNFLVYIPPTAGLNDAQKIVKDISKFDVDEAIILQDGPYKNAISLGFFNNLNKAKRHAEYIRYLGYDAQYTEQQAAREVFWLDYDEPFGSNTPVQAWSADIDKTSEVQRIPRACR